MSSPYLYIHSYRGTLSKLFNRKSEKSKSPAPEELKPSAEKERIKSGDWEVVEPPKPEASPSPEVIKKPPPVVSQKPKPRRVQSLDEGEEPRRKPVMHTSAPMSELANVLKQGVALKPSKVVLDHPMTSHCGGSLLYHNI